MRILNRETWPLSTVSLATLASKHPAEGRNAHQMQLTGQAAQDVYGLFDGKISQLYREGEQTYRVTIRPLFPLEPWQATGGWRGPEIFPTTPTKEMSCP